MSSVLNRSSNKIILMAVFGGFIAALVVFVYFIVDDPALALSGLGLLSYLGLFFLIAWRFYQAGFDLFSPVVLLGSFLLLAYPIKGLYILSSSAYGPYVARNYRFLLNTHHMIYFGGALALSALCSLVFLSIINVQWSKQSVHKLFFNGRAWDPRKIFLAMMGISLMLAALFLWLISTSGGLKSYLQLVAGRHSFFYGRYFIYTLIGLFPVISCFFLASHFERRNHYPKIYLLGLLILVTVANILVSILAGNRSTFLIGFLVPMLIYWHYRVKAIKITQAVLTIGVILFISIFYITTFRGSQVAAKLTSENIRQNISKSISNLSSSVFAGPDLVQLDVLMVTMQEIPSHHPYFKGDSIKALLAFPIPRALYPDKPVRGNWLFTDAVFPSWRVNLSGFTVSYMGDWYMNFGTVGVMIGMILLGIGLRALFLKINPKVSWVSAIIYGLTFSKTLALFRSDIFTLADFGITSFFVTAIILFCSKSKRSSTLISEA